MSDDGHNYFFNFPKEMPWKKENEMTDHICEWGLFSIGSPHQAIKCKCGFMDWAEVLRRINDYERLKRATEVLSADVARDALSKVNYPGHLQKFKQYADILEGKE